MGELDRNALLEAFASWGVGPEQKLVGVEYERHLLLPDGAPLTYAEAGGVRHMLQALGRRGWRLEFEEDRPIAAFSEVGSVTLEPGCQWEFSGRPHRTAAQATREAASFADLTDEILAEVGSPARQVALGFTPFVRIDDIPFVPKGRYAQMKAYLIQVGDLAHHMMKGTAATQASFDFHDEQDCARKVRTASMLAPLNTALFANSPYIDGRASDWASFRGHIWTRTDPARTGIPADRTFSFEAWVDYLLDVPMMFVKGPAGYESSGGRTFRSWMEAGIDGRWPTWKDWDVHLTTVFPEVRVKRQIEVRGADCVPLPLAGAFAALWSGIMYARDPEEILAFAERFAAHGSQIERFHAACRGGARAWVGGHEVAAWAIELVDRVTSSLPAEDADLLEPLRKLLAERRSPAHELLASLGPSPDPAALIARAAWSYVT